MFLNSILTYELLQLFVHGSNLESLYEHVPKRLLPEEYGGEAGKKKFIKRFYLQITNNDNFPHTGKLQSIINDWEKKIMFYRDFLLEEDNFGVIEKNRVEKLKNSDNLFGVEGSFRKLEID